MNPPQKNGFTLIELLLVTVIIGIVVGIATPRFNKTFENIKLENFALNVAETIRYANQRAVLNRGNYRLVLSEKDRAYWLEELDNNKLKKTYSRLKDKAGMTRLIPDGITFDSKNTEILFGRAGEIEKTAISVKNGYKKEFIIKIEKNFADISVSPAE